MGVVGKSPKKEVDQQDFTLNNMPNSLGETKLPSQTDLNERHVQLPQPGQISNPQNLNLTTRSPNPMNLQDNTGTLKTTLLSTENEHMDSGNLSRTQSKIDAKFSLKK